MTALIAGTNAFTAAEAAAGTSTSSPSPPLSETQYYYATTTSATAVQRWSGLTAQNAWQFRRLIYVGTAVSGTDLDMVALRQGSDATNALIVRVQGTDKLRVVDSSGSFVFTSTPTVPHDTWYRLEGYGDASAGTGRIALFPLGSSTAVSGFDTGSISLGMGGTGPTGIRLGKCSAATSWAGKLGWCKDEFYTGTDVTTGFRGPYSTDTPSASPTSSSAAVVKLTANATDTGGTVSTYAWSITSVPSGATPTMYDSTTATPHFIPNVAGNHGIQLVVTGSGGGTYTGTMTVNASLTSSSTPYRFVWRSSTSSWVAL